MKDYILEHMHRYPYMEIQDMVKLLYQGEFGGGHMIADPQISLERLQKEHSAVCGALAGAPLLENTGGGRNPAFEAAGGGKNHILEAVEGGKNHILEAVGGGKNHILEAAGGGESPILEAVEGGGGPIFEAIGDGKYRLYLKDVERWFRLETVNRFFVESAKESTGTVCGFEKKLDLLRSLCAEGDLTFPLEEVDGYLKGYRQQGYPAVSHSPSYRSHYQPSYRVVNEEYCRYWPVFSAVDQALRGEDGQRALIVAIDGRSGAGKTYLARLMGTVYDCNLFHMDEFFLRPEQKDSARLKETGGNVDYERFFCQVLSPLLEIRKEFSYRIYDCREQRLTGTVTVTNKRLNVVEGSYSHHPYFGSPYTLKIFLDVDGEEQRRRIRQRNGPRMLSRFVEEWIPKEEAYFHQFSIREKSDICLL